MRLLRKATTYRIRSQILFRVSNRGDSKTAPPASPAVPCTFLRPPAFSLDDPRKLY